MIMNKENLVKDIKKALVVSVASIGLIAPIAMNSTNNVHAESWAQFVKPYNRETKTEGAKEVKEDDDYEFGGYFQKENKRANRSLHNDRKSIHYYYRTLNRNQKKLHYAERKQYDNWARKLRKSIRYDKYRINKLNHQISYLRHELEG